MITVRKVCSHSSEVDYERYCEPRASVVECACLFWRFLMGGMTCACAKVTLPRNPKAAEGTKKGLPHSTTLARGSQCLSILARLLMYQIAW